MSLYSIAFSLCVCNTVLMELCSCISTGIGSIFKWKRREMEKGFKCTKHCLFQNTPNYEVVLRDLSYCYCSIFMFKKNHIPRETLFIHTNQIQASERRRLFLCCKLPCQKHGLSFLTTVSYLLCSHTA